MSATARRKISAALERNIALAKATSDTLPNLNAVIQYGFLWFLMVPYGSLWFLMVGYGFVWRITFACLVSDIADYLIGGPEF
eukprot:9467627-Pyramimonas_sp.AAC.2